MSLPLLKAITRETEYGERQRRNAPKETLSRRCRVFFVVIVPDVVNKVATVDEVK